jgi:hypothetical protein
MVGLAACSSGGGSATPAFIHIEEGVEETAVALTATARANPTPTPGPSPTPTATSTPYAIPTNPPDFDGSTVITTVGRQALTLADYQKHVRFDRYRLLYPVVKLAERNGVARTLDLTRSENQYLVSLFTTLADSYSFGRQSRRLMIIDAVVEQEARRRGIEVDPNQFNAKLLSFLGLIVGEKGQMPPEFEERYAEFLQGLRTYADMSEEEFRKIVRARTLYDQLEFVIGHEPGAVNISEQARVGVQVRDIILSDYMTALLVAERVRDGESLHDVAASLGFARPEQDWRVLRWGEQGITDEIRQAVYRAAPGDVIGPLQLNSGDSNPFLGLELGQQRSYSEDVARKIDAEVRRIVSEAYDRARAVLKARQAQLVQVAEALLEKEVLERKEFLQILQSGAPLPEMAGASAD